MTTTIPEHVPRDRVFDVDVYDGPEFKDELHGNFARFHERYPAVFYTPRSEGYWVVTRQALIEQVLQDTEHFSSSVGLIPKPSQMLPMLPLTLDPPAHTPYRVALMRFFGPKFVRRMEDDIRQQAAAMIDAVVADGRCDFLSRVGAGLPVTVFMNLMGLPLSRFDEFRTLVTDYFQPLSNESRLAGHARILRELDEIIADRQRAPKDDLVSRLAHEDIGGGRKLTADELQSMCFLLFVAGMDTVANAASFSFFHLAGRPELQQRLANDASLIPGFVEESLRMYGNINTPRIVMKDTVLDGAPMRAGEMVLVMLSLAGRDERFVADPDRFDATRAEHPHMAFGGGAHVCAGQHLARIELRAIAQEWLKRIPSFRLATGFKPVFRSFQVMAMERLELEWGAAAR